MDTSKPFRKACASERHGVYRRRSIPFAPALGMHRTAPLSEFHSLIQSKRIEMLLRPCLFSFIPCLFCRPCLFWPFRRDRFWHSEVEVATVPCGSSYGG